MSRRTPTLLLALLTVLIARPAAAQTDWAVAMRKDDQIKSLVERLLPFVEKVDGGTTADGVILYRQIMTKAGDNKNERCVNAVMLVRDLTAFPERLLTRTVGNKDDIARIGAFVFRDGAVVARLEPTYQEGPDDISLDRAVFDWSDVRSGDVIGMSYVQSQEGPFGNVGIRLADVFPSVYVAVSAEGGEKFSYKTRWWGVDADALQIKETGKRDGRTVAAKFNARVIGAYADAPDEGPFPDDYPRAALVLDEIYFEPEGDAAGFLKAGWLPVGGWNSITMGNAGAIENLAENASDTSIMRTAITTGKTTAHAKAAAITDWVRKTIERQEGDLIVDGAVREDIAQRMKDQSGTENEIFLLAAVLMKQSGVPVTVAMLRDPALGDLDKSWENGAQFSDALLRVEDEGVVRYYAPQCAECEAGDIPPEWVGVEALVYDASLYEEAQAFQEKRQKEAVASGAIDISRLQREVAAQDWSRFETITMPE